VAGEAGGKNLRARTRASSILMQADNMITAKTHGPFKHFLGLIALVPCKTCGPYDEMSTCVSPLAASCTSQTAAAHKPSLQRTACLTTHVLPAALLQQCFRIVPMGSRCTRKEAKPPQSTIKATACCHGHVCHSHTKHARMFSARAPRGESEGGGPGGASTCCVGDPSARTQATSQWLSRQGPRLPALLSRPERTPSVQPPEKPSLATSAAAPREAEGAHKAASGSLACILLRTSTGGVSAGGGPGGASTCRVGDPTARPEANSESCIPDLCS